MEINKDFIQAYEGEVREEMLLNPNSVNSLKDTLITEDVSNANFNGLFKTRSNVQFRYNPNMRKFRRLLHGEKVKDDQRPVMLIYYPDQYMEYFGNQF